MVKGSLIRTIFQLPLDCVRMGPGPGTRPYREVKGRSQTALGMSRGTGMSFPVSDSLWTPLFCLTVCITWDLANPTAMSVSCGILLRRHKKVHTGHWAVFAARQQFSGHGRLAPITELILLCLSNVLLHPCLIVLCFPCTLPYQHAVDTSVWTSIPGDTQQMPHAQQKLIVKIMPLST